MQDLLRWWIIFVSNKLGITEYMLPETNAANNNVPNIHPIPNLNLHGNPNLPVNLNQVPVANHAAVANQPARVVYKPPYFGWRVSFRIIAAKELT